MLCWSTITKSYGIQCILYGLLVQVVPALNWDVIWANIPDTMTLLFYLLLHTCDLITYITTNRERTKPYYLLQSINMKFLKVWDFHASLYKWLMQSVITLKGWSQYICMHKICFKKITNLLYSKYFMRCSHF